jgi:hypothetical protein
MSCANASQPLQVVQFAAYEWLMARIVAANARAAAGAPGGAVRRALPPGAGQARRIALLHLLILLLRLRFALRALLMLRCYSLLALCSRKMLHCTACARRCLLRARRPSWRRRSQRIPFWS